MGFLHDLAQEALANQTKLDIDLATQAMKKPVPEAEYFLGLDLGQAQDFSALVGLKRTESLERSPAGKRRFHFRTVGVKRWPLRTPYTSIAEDLVDTCSKPPLKGCVLGIDKTGVGAGVVEIIRLAKPDAIIKPILITGGNRSIRQGDTWNVPKMELVAAVTSAIESGRLEIPMMNHDAKVMSEELKAFRSKVTAAGNKTAAADWRSKQHDDLVLAIALAIFLGDQRKREFFMRIGGETIR